MLILLLMSELLLSIKLGHRFILNYPKQINNKPLRYYGDSPSARKPFEKHCFKSSLTFMRNVLIEETHDQEIIISHFLKPINWLFSLSQTLPY